MRREKEVGVVFLDNLEECLGDLWGLNREFCVGGLNIFGEFIEVVMGVIVEELKNMLCWREVDRGIEVG